MVAIRVTSTTMCAVRAAARIGAPRTYRTFMTDPRLFAQQGYGNGGGDAAAKAAMSKSMHEAADAEDGNTSSKGGGAQSPKKSGFGSRSSSSSNSGDVAEAATRDGGEALKGPQGKGAPSPKLHNQALPGSGADELSEEQKREVEEHNRDFEKRHDRAAPAAKDKVDKKFWQVRQNR